MEKQRSKSVSLHIDTLGDDMRGSIALTARLGYTGVTVGIGHPQLNAADFGATARRHWMKVLKSHQLSLTAIRVGVGVSGCADTAHAELLIQQSMRAVQLARECGEGLVVAYLGEPPASRPPASPTFADRQPESAGSHAGHDSSLVDAVLHELLSAADRAGITLALSSGHPLWLKDTIKPYCGKTVGAALDSYRVLTAGQPPEAAAAELAGIINTWICADVVRSGGMAQSVPLGAGQANPQATMKILDEQYFTGPIIMDIRGLADPAGAAEHAAKKITELLSIGQSTPTLRR